jgi:N-acetylneuraminic acid mutarotase
VSLAPMPQGGAVYGAAGVDGQIYVFGACAYGADGEVASIYFTGGKYDPLTNTWSTIAPIPTPRIDFATTVYEDKIYIIGGKKSIVGASLDTVEVYDPATNTWFSRTPMPTARDSMQANVVYGKIYVVGGRVSLINPAGGVLYDANEVYDPKTNKWASETPVPYPSTGITSVGFDEKIYLFGGDKHSIGPVDAVNTTQIYDPVSKKWSLGTPIPNPVGHALVCATSGLAAPKRIYIFGGHGNGGSPSNLNQIYDPVTDEWAMGAKQYFYYGEMSIVVVNDLIYIIGGSYSEKQRDHNSNYWDPPSYNPPPPFRAFNYQYTPISYETGASAPIIVVSSPQNRNYPSKNVSVTFNIDESAIWMGYRLDQREITTIEGNITVEGLTDGSHNITIYAKGSSGSIGKSDTVNFSIGVQPKSEGVSTLEIITATGITIIVF